MTTLESVRALAAIQLGAVGLSHVIAHRAWTSFFIGLRSKGDAGVLCVALLSLGVGSFVVAFHPVWSGIPAALTVYGWLQVLKGTVYLTFPAIGLRKLRVVSEERSRMFVLPGVGLLALAALLAYDLFA